MKKGTKIAIIASSAVAAIALLITIAIFISAKMCEATAEKMQAVWTHSIFTGCMVDTAKNSWVPLDKVQIEYKDLKKSLKSEPK